MRRIGGAVALGVVSLAAALALVEVALRLLPQSLYLLHFAEPSVYRYDDELVYALRPVGEHNSLGLRNREIGPKGSRRRVLTLGDSYTYGHGVAVRDAYPQQLEGALNGRGANAWEVINAGVPGYNFDQAVRLLDRLLAHGVDPDWVIVGFEPKDLGAQNVLFTLSDGEIEPVPAWRNWIYLQLRLRTQTPAFLQGSRTYEFVARRLSGSDPFGVLPGGDKDELIRWQIDKIERLIDSLVAESRRSGFELLILNYPDKAALDHGGDYRHGTYFRLPVKVLGENANEHMERLRGIFAESGAHTLDALEAFLALNWTPESYAPLYLGEDPHMSARGNRRLAQLVAGYLRGVPPVTR